MTKPTAKTSSAGQSVEAPRHELRVLATKGFPGYALLDSGAGRKLERFGDFVVDRPEPQALWRPSLTPEAWNAAHAVFRSVDEDDDGEPGKWRKNKPVPETWPVRVLGVTMQCRLSGFRHLELFPEQLPHWEWMIQWLTGVGEKPPRVLNLFAYTGAASLLAASAGAVVTHVDASRKAVAWAKENQAASRTQRGEHPLDSRGRPQVCCARGPARQDLSSCAGRSAQVRARAGRRGLGCLHPPLASSRRRCLASRTAPVGAGADDLRYPSFRSCHRWPRAGSPCRASGQYRKRRACRNR